MQVLDSFDNDTHPDGQASSLYKKSVTLVNASRGPGQWQTYDIILREKRVRMGVIQLTIVLHNGIVTQCFVKEEEKHGRWPFSSGSRKSRSLPQHLVPKVGGCSGEGWKMIVL